MEVELVFVSKKTFGKYTGTLEWCVKDGVWVDNCFKSTVTDKAGNIIKVIDKFRPIPEKVKPDYIVSPPTEGEPPIEGTGKLWYFDPRYLTEEYVFAPPLRKTVTAWVIKVDDDIFIFDAERGSRIGRNFMAGEERYATLSGGDWEQDMYAYDVGEKFDECGLVGEKQISTLSESEAAISDGTTKYLFIMAHSISGGGFSLNGKNLTCKRVEELMRDREPMKFTLLDSCSIMKSSCKQAFTKNQSNDSVVIGLTVSGSINYKWINTFFKEMNCGGKSWKDAYDIASATFSWVGELLEFFGDENAKFVPVEKKTVTFKSVPLGATISIDSLGSI